MDPTDATGTELRPADERFCWHRIDCSVRPNAEGSDDVIPYFPMI